MRGRSIQQKNKDVPDNLVPVPAKTVPWTGYLNLIVTGPFWQLSSPIDSLFIDFSGQYWASSMTASWKYEKANF